MRSILLIEDNEFMRVFLQRILHKEYQVYTVKSYKEALEWLFEAKVDLLISDFPDYYLQVDELLKLISISSSKKIPVFLLTNQDKSEERINAFNWGAKECLSKPFNPIELKLRVQNMFSCLN